MFCEEDEVTKILSRSVMQALVGFCLDGLKSAAMKEWRI